MFVPTRSSLLKNKSEDSCEMVIFETKKRTSSTAKSNIAEKTKPGKKEQGDVDLKKLRYEVIKFGSSGFDDSKMNESRIALAVSLGAKPPKREAKNYKEILARKKQEKDDEGRIKKQKESSLLLKKREMKWKGRRGKEAKGLLKNYGRVKVNKE